MCNISNNIKDNEVGQIGKLSDSNNLLRKYYKFPCIYSLTYLANVFEHLLYTGYWPRDTTVEQLREALSLLIVGITVKDKIHKEKN